MADEQTQTGPAGLETQGAATENQQAQAEGQQEASQSNLPKDDGMPKALGEANIENPGTKEEAPQQRTAPEKYEPFSFGENPAIDPTQIEQFSTAAREAGLSQEQAQKVLDSLAPSVATKLRADLVRQAGEWLKASEADPEFGGAAFEANKGIAVSAYQKLATPELRDILNNSGLCNHPEVIRLFYRIGKMTSQDSGVKGEPVSRSSGLEAMYPNSNMRW
ncbi:hypothetical protein [uncultured Parasutterella sp.]|uniref:hypothetical protein n=1 Tax=uncultured Parasutterella sp. TaxID=1263098 RepID=UPI00272A5E68|nr:hypothetical protein [uncultured Parasutterella sp.]